MLIVFKIKVQEQMSDSGMHGNPPIKTRDSIIILILHSSHMLTLLSEMEPVDKKFCHDVFFQDLKQLNRYYK